MSEQMMKVNYGLIDFGKGADSEKCALGSFQYIMNDISDIKERYVTLGFHLHEFNQCEYYKDFGYSTFQEFCEKNIPLDKSAISRCINVWYEFSAVQGSSRKMWLDDKYTEFNYSQLQEMISMSKDERKLVTPEMTIKEIRDIKKAGRGTVAAEKSVATSQLDIAKLARLNGAAKSNYISSVKEKDAIVIDLYDRDGNYIGGNTWISLLSYKDGHMIVRLWNDINPYEKRN